MDVTTLLGSFVCLVARAFGVVICLPFGETLTIVPRLLLSVLLAVATQPGVGVEQGGTVAIMLSEVALGLILGLPYRFIVDVSECVGELLDTARGQTIGSILEPLNGQGSSDLAAIFRIASCALAFHFGALTALAEALHASYNVFPLGGPFSVTDAGTTMLSACGLMLGDALRVVGIWIVSFVLVDILAALAARICSGLSFATLSHAVKLLLLVAIGLGTFAYWEEGMQGVVERLRSLFPNAFVPASAGGSYSMVSGHLAEDR